MSIRKYNFGLFLDGFPYTVYPIWKDTMNLDIDLEENEQFFREKLSEGFCFVRADFDLINDSPLETHFRLVIEDNSNLGVTFWQGDFYKTDLKDVDEDNRTLEVLPNPIDGYDDILARKDKVFNLIDLAPEREEVLYVKQTLIQLYVPGSEFVTNFLDGTWWQQPVIESTGSLNDLETVYKFGFDSIPNTVKTFVAGPSQGGMVPDVSGEYIQDGFGGTERVDNAYGFVLQDIGNGGDQWTIVDRNNSDTVVYAGPVGEFFLIGGWDFTGGTVQGLILTSETSSSVCRIFTGYVYARYLTDELTVNGTPTEELPSPDITNDSFGYKRVLPIEVNEVIPFGTTTIEPDRYGKVVDDAANNAGQYFNTPVSPNGNRLYPLVRSEWLEVSFWFYYTAALRQLQEDGSRQVVLRHAYPLASVIKVLLREIAPGITYEETTDYSDFLNNTSANPVSSDNYVRLFITPKTNVKVGDYDQAATIADIKFSQVLDFLRNAYDLYWHVDEQNRFRIEHVSWYEKGGSYAAEVVGQDLTTFVEPKTSLPWDFKSNVFNYDKGDLPEQIKFNWMDKTSVPFDGFNIDIRSVFVQKGTVKSKPIDVFTSDLDFMQVIPSLIANEGFAVLACDDVSGEWVVPFVSLTADGEDYKIQNGKLSFVYLHPRYHKNNLPAPNITINKVDDTATTVTRFRNQELTFPFPNDLNPMELVETNAGNGRIKTASINLISRTAKAQIKHNG